MDLGPAVGSAATRSTNRSGFQRCGADERLRAVREHFVDLDPERELRRPSLDGERLEQLGVVDDRRRGR